MQRQGDVVYFESFCQTSKTGHHEFIRFAVLAKLVGAMLSSDTDLETGITEKIALTKKKSSKKKAKSTPVVPTDHGKNEGDDPHWAYEPPEGAQLLDHSIDAGEFEWDAIKNDQDTEIWLIRVPDSVRSDVCSSSRRSEFTHCQIKSKHLKGLEIDSPSSSRTALIGHLSKKNASYDVWCIGGDDAEVVGAEELGGLSCLLPRKRKDGKLYIGKHRRVFHPCSSRSRTCRSSETGVTTYCYLYSAFDSCHRRATTFRVQKSSPVILSKRPSQTCFCTLRCTVSAVSGGGFVDGC